MKFLFERMVDVQNWNAKDMIRLSLEQLMSSNYNLEMDVPDGIYNFGMPNPVELSNSEPGLKVWATTLKKRIAAFEPRIHLLSLEVVNSHVQVEAILTDTQEIVSWRY